MRLRNIPGSREAIAQSEYVIQEDVLKSWKGRWNELFGNHHPLFLEIGMGKGRFITELAVRNPENNYLGIEKYSSVLLRAIQKREQQKEPANLFFVRMDAEELCDVFGPGEVSGIYLNFSDPWPKDRHAKRRLPGKEFLERYTAILSPGGRVEFKTDNKDLFSFALESAREAGWTIDSFTWNLHRDPVLSKDNIMTEYEEKFSKLGNPIFKMISHPDRNAPVRPVSS